MRVMCGIREGEGNVWYVGRSEGDEWYEGGVRVMSGMWGGEGDE